METVGSVAQIHQRIMSGKVLVTWSQLKQWATTVSKEFVVEHGHEPKCYGVPRGGMYIAALFDAVDTPEEADWIVDDIIDSGATQAKYIAKYQKPFFAPIDKTFPPDQNSFHVRAGTWVTFPWEVEQNETAEENVVRILQAIGEDPNREGLIDTPKRYIKFLREFLTPPEFNYTMFHNDGIDQMIMVTDIDFQSMCEHHMAPFIGKADVAYIPSERIVGISKLARAVEKFSRRLQNQERITQQVAEELQSVLDAKGVAVRLRAEHLCMCMRGVRKPGAMTTTIALTGVFQTDVDAKHEFINQLRHER